MSEAVNTWAPAPARATTRDWLAVMGTLIGALMAFLDIQITNSSLADIDGAIGATSDEGSWVSTAYLVAEIVVIPLTGWLTSVFGLRRCLVVNSALFLIFSVGCAWSGNLTEMILFRAGQGFTGAVLVPTAITVIGTRLPPADQVLGNAIFGAVFTLSPSFGPVIGGWLTENLSWQYIFYINLPTGIFSIALLLYGFDAERMRLGELIRGDWWGILTMTAGLSTLTVVLEEGQSYEWFGSPLIGGLSAVAGISLVLFLIVELTTERPLINLWLLRRRSIAAANILMGLFGVIGFGLIYATPVFLAEILGYDPQHVGDVVMWSGFPSLLFSPILLPLMRTVDFRILVGAGAAMLAISCFLCVGVTRDFGGDQFMVPQVIRSIGLMLFAVPLLQLVTTGLTGRDAADASSLNNMLRNLGGSVGVAAVATMLQSREQFHFSALAERITQNGFRTQAAIAQLTSAVSGASGSGRAPTMQAMAQMAHLVREQASILAFSDIYLVLGVLCLVCVAGAAFLPKFIGAPIQSG